MWWLQKFSCWEATPVQCATSSYSLQQDNISVIPRLLYTMNSYRSWQLGLWVQDLRKTPHQLLRSLMGLRNSQCPALGLQASPRLVFNILGELGGVCPTYTHVLHRGVKPLEITLLLPKKYSSRILQLCIDRAQQKREGSQGGRLNNACQLLLQARGNVLACSLHACTLFYCSAQNTPLPSDQSYHRHVAVLT